MIQGVPASATTAEAKARRNGSEAAPDPHRSAWVALCRTHAAVTGRLQEALTDAGLPPLGWYEVLSALADAPEQHLKMGDLADALAISRGGLTKLVDRLVKAGLLERTFCDTDRRVSYAALCPAGAEMLAEMQPIVAAEIEASFAASLSARQAGALGEALAKVGGSVCSSVG
jgi:DNA-binding MarR family transcriptional regulator